MSPNFDTARRLIAGCIFAMVLVQPLQAVAEDKKIAPPEGVSPYDWLDAPRQFLSESFVNLSTKVDRYFADERVFQESRTSYLRFYGDLVVQKDGSSNFDPQLQAKIVLPALEKRLHLLIETNANETAPEAVPVPTSSTTTQKGVPSVNAPKDFLASLELLLKDTRKLNINTEAGIRIHGFSLDPFVRARASNVQIVRKWQFRLTESLYWFEQSGAGESTQYDADYKISDSYLARSRSLATWSDHDQQFYYQQSFYLFHPIDDNHALSYQGNIFGESQPNSRVTEYDVSATWRIRIHREWLFFDIQPGLSWPDTEDFHLTPTILFRVEAIFGDLACGCYGIL